MSKEKLARIVNHCMLEANNAKDEIELGKLTKRLWDAIDKYVATK